MNWIFHVHEGHPVAHAIAVLSLVCVFGMALGRVRVRGVGIGTAGVLFAGILFGHYGQAVARQVDHHTLAFVKEFGLVLFVFTIGLQLGPGFFAALRTAGLKLNALAAAVVLLGAGGAPLAGWLAGFDPAAVLGLFAGASTNTPALGAATQALGTLPGIDADRLVLPALAYAVSYPVAILGIIGTLLLLQKAFGADPVAESAALAAARATRTEPLEQWTVVVENPELDGLSVAAMREKAGTGVTVSRLRRGESTRVATEGVEVRRGDRLAAVGTGSALEAFARVVGARSAEDLSEADETLLSRRVVVTARAVLGRTVGELDLDSRFGVAVTDVTRADLAVTAVPDLRLQFGDVVQVVGREEGLGEAADALGDSVKELDETHFIPLFLGIFLGILLGTLPIPVPGFPEPVRLGLAGGPLLVALLLGRLGHVGRLVWHMPANTNLAFREFGIALFFAAVGLTAGEKFFATVLTPTGLAWMGAGVCLTMAPLLVVGTLARVGLGMNFADISGLLAGSMTDPPALAFATSACGSDAPTVAYATVYPLTTLLRILCAQALALLLCG